MLINDIAQSALELVNEMVERSEGECEAVLGCLSALHGAVLVGTSKEMLEAMCVEARLNLELIAANRRERENG